jgi:hypothetical protein
VALRAPDIELKGLLSGFSAAPSYAGAPMLRADRLALRALRSWNRLLWTVSRGGDTSCRGVNFDPRRGSDGQRADDAADMILGDR